MERIGPSSVSNFTFVKTHLVPTPKYCHCVFELEEFRNEDGQYFWLVHFVIKKKLTAALLKSIKREWVYFRRFVRGPLYAVRNDGDEVKWKRFVSLFGFQPTNIFLPCNNGVIRELFIAVSPDGK